MGWRPTLLCLLICVSQAAHAGTVRLEGRQYSDHERLLLLGLSKKATASMRDGALLLSDPRMPIRLSSASPSEPYLKATHSEGGSLVLDFEPGTVVRTREVKGGLAIDLMRQIAPPSSGTAGSVQHPPEAVGSGPIPALPAPFLASVEGAVQTALAKSPVPASSAPSNGARVEPAPKRPAPSIPTTPVKLAGTAEGTSNAESQVFQLPFSRGVGVALRRSASDVLLVFDQSRAIDTSSFSHDRRIDAISSAVTDVSTTIALRLRGPADLRLQLDANGWELRFAKTGAAALPIVLRPGLGDSVVFEVAHPGHSLVVRDPSTGRMLLVGTTTSPAQGMLSPRSSALFTLDRTDVGLVVEPLSDHVLLREASAAFVLATDDGTPLHVGRDFADPFHAADRFQRLVDLPNGSTSQLLRRFQSESMVAAATPVRDRSASRLSCVGTLLSLGLGREAATVLRASLADDPRLSGSEQASLLRDIVDVTDPSQAEATSQPPDFDGTRVADDRLFWSTLASYPVDDADRRHNADIVRADIGLFQGYAAPLRHAAGSRVAQTLLAGGSAADLQALVALPDDPGIAVAKAVALDRLGSRAAALARLAAIQNGNDRARSADALRRALEMKVAAGTLRPGKAADQLEEHRLDWRLLGEEEPVLLEEAAWRLRGRQFAAAFNVLRNAREMTSARHGEIDDAIHVGLQQLADPREAASVPDQEIVAITDRYADLLHNDPVLAVKLAALRADRLERLGLPGRAAFVLEEAAAAKTGGTDRGMLELRSAELRLEGGDDASATSSLRAADADGLPPSAAAQRGVLAAKLLDAAGHRAEALAALPAGEDPAILDLRARLLAEGGDWRGSETALATLTKTIPANGPLSSGDAGLVLRLATSAFRAGDRQEFRMVEGRVAERLTGEADRSEMARLARVEGLVAANDASGDPPSPMPIGK